MMTNGKMDMVKRSKTIDVHKIEPSGNCMDLMVDWVISIFIVSSSFV